MKNTLFLLALLGTLLLAFPTRGADLVVVEAYCMYVIDGDSIVVEQNGLAVVVRLLGIDCPERHDDGAEEAEALTRELCEGKFIRLETDPSESVPSVDPWFRNLCYIYVPGTNGEDVFVQAELVHAGLAVPYWPEGQELSQEQEILAGFE